MKRHLTFICAFAILLGCCNFASADFRTERVRAGNGSVQLRINEIASGPAEIEISHLELSTGLDLLVIRGLNGTRIDGAQTVFRELPVGNDLIIQGLTYSGGARVDITDVMFVLPDDVFIRDVEHVNIQGLILTGSHADLVIEGPYQVSITQSFSRDVKVGLDYAARNIDITNSLFARNIWTKGRFTNLTNVNVGNDLYVYGTYGHDTINLEGITSRMNTAPFPPIKVDLGPNNDAVSFRNCRAAFIDVEGGSGTDVTYNKGGNNFSIGAFNTNSIEKFD